MFGDIQVVSEGDEGQRIVFFFMLERMIKMGKVRKECLFVAFIEIEKAYDRVNRNKLFELMRRYGMQEILVDVIERIYNGSMKV